MPRPAVQLGVLNAQLTSQNAAVVQACVPFVSNLGTWCSERRKQHKAGRLSTERVAALERLGFVWDPSQEAFDKGLAELVAYVTANGDARVPAGYKTPTGFKLIWRAFCQGGVMNFSLSRVG